MISYGGRSKVRKVLASVLTDTYKCLDSWSLQYYCGSYDNKLCNGKPVSESKSEIEKGSATGSATSSATSTVSKVTIEPSTTTLSEVKPTAAASLRVGAVSGVLSLVALLVMW